ncbi:MAG TPA: YdeI/OmpD-associated family protein [Devosia sp.]|nr:YdeI/OmpD-associated family protein [Devosia sp.]
MVLSVSPDIGEALRLNPAALSRFETLPPSHKAEYLKWIDEAKRAETRARRIAGMIDRLEGRDGQA